MPDFHLENLHGRREGRVIAGCDEAGRGPLAGPVVAAAVIIPPDFPGEIASRLDDSKRLARAEREALSAIILNTCACAISRAGVAEIDTVNILQASLMAMGRAVARLENGSGAARKLDAVLVDGNRLPPAPCAAHACIRGDAKSLSIAAASIIAKAARDAIMRGLHEDFPQYGFARHMGYGTAAHLAALREHGPCPHHRRSFAPVRNWKSLAVGEAGQAA